MIEPRNEGKSRSTVLATKAAQQEEGARPIYFLLDYCRCSRYVPHKFVSSSCELYTELDKINTDKTSKKDVAIEQ